MFEWIPPQSFKNRFHLKLKSTFTLEKYQLQQKTFKQLFIKIFHPDLAARKDFMQKLGVDEDFYTIIAFTVSVLVTLMSP